MYVRTYVCMNISCVCVYICMHYVYILIYIIYIVFVLCMDISYVCIYACGMCIYIYTHALFSSLVGAPNPNHIEDIEDRIEAALQDAVSKRDFAKTAQLQARLRQSRAEVCHADREL